MRNKEFVLPLLIASAVSLVVSIILIFVNLLCGIVCLVLSAGIVLTFALINKKRYQKIEKLNDYLSAVVRGDYSFDIESNQEGELSILSNNLYKVITELHAYSEKVSADKVNLSKSLADISHQLKTPLTAIGVSTDILSANLQGTENQKFISIIEDESEKMNWLVQSLLKLSKIDAGTVAMNMQSVDLRDLLGEVVAPFEINLELKNITLEVTKENFELNCDRQWFTEALRNILKNAVEHSSRGGRISISAKKETLFSEISISDTGSGILPEDLPHIFERFYKSKNSKGDSVGIGLALSKEIVTKHNGKIEVETEPGKGTTFTVKLYKGII